MNPSSSTRLKYDESNYQQSLYESTNPLQYMTYMGNVEHVNKCRHDPNFFPTRNHPTILDIESELRGQTRVASKASKFHYTPDCKSTTGSCIPTFASKAPVIYAPEVCPIVFNNIPKYSSTGLKSLEDMNNTKCH